MTKKEVIKAIEDGHMVTHRYFSKDEYVTKSNDYGHYIDERGRKIPSIEFWICHSSDSFANGWKILD
jgi:hypothetical protein